VTVTPIPCGVESRWAPLDARYDDYRFCRTGDAVLLQSLVSYHEFDGQVQKKSFVCDPGSYLRPPTATPGATYAGHCAGSGTDIVMAGKVIGVEPVTVGSQPVRALHVQLKETLTGSIQGTRWTDAWFAMADDMVLRFQSRTDAPSAQTTFGPTHYTEQFSIWLQSLTPQR
jgi:hypothetical protein